MAVDPKDKFVKLGTVTKMFSEFASNIGISARPTPIYDPKTGKYTNESIVKWIDSFADGLIYGVQIPKYDANKGTSATKTDANASLILEPSSDTVVGRNDYLNKKLFMCPRVNGGADADGIPYVTAIEGLDDWFSATLENTWALTPIYYFKYTDKPAYVQKQFTDTATDGFTACQGAHTSSGLARPYLLRACYLDDGTFSSKSGTLIHKNNVTDYSLRNLFTKSIERTDGLSYLCYGDITYQLDFMQLMFGVKAPRTIAEGRTAEALNASKIGFYARFDRQTSGKYNIVISVDSAHTYTKDYLHEYDVYDDGQRGKVWAITNVVKNQDGSIECDIVGSAPESYASLHFIGVMSGSLDNVKGTFGSRTAEGLTNGKEPFKFQNCECMLGCAETVVNEFFNNKKIAYAPNINDAAPDWSYPQFTGSFVQQDTQINENGSFIGEYAITNGCYIPSSMGATSTTGFCAYFNSPRYGGAQTLVVNGSACPGERQNTGIGVIKGKMHDWERISSRLSIMSDSAQI